MKQILIVEDDRDVAQAIADVLEQEGYSTALFANGREALDYLRRGNRPDLILLDLMMPVMDGWEFRRQQEATPELAAIPVVAVSADGNIERKASTLHADGALAKPATIDALLDEVERVCGPSQ
jgi:CheY-like chemotaxis protein